MVSEKSKRGLTPAMGSFTVEIGVGHPGGGRLTTVLALVDTGSFHSMLPAALLAQLGIRPSERQEFGIADGSRVEWDVGMARIAIDGREWHCPVIFGPEGEYLLGATTLEIFTMTVDMVEERLVPRQLRARSI